MNDLRFQTYVATSPTTQKDVTGVIHALAEADPHSKHDFYQDFEFIDDVPGRVPGHDLTVMARKLEMEFVWKSFISTNCCMTTWEPEDAKLPSRLIGWPRTEAGLTA